MLGDSLFSSKMYSTEVSLLYNKTPKLIYLYLWLHTSVMIHTLCHYFKPVAGDVKQQGKRLPDPNGPRSFIIPAEAIQDADDAPSVSSTQSSQQVQCGKCKQPRGSYMYEVNTCAASTNHYVYMYVLANGSEAAILKCLLKSSSQW